ncbi:helix-turn-helix domain-containing protein [Galactobacillus timonensis]|uniref:helix-turn-helix domain-containing protein n=1 Tax=Galactobacillus timonensis TaxID=2041840 RepID=UPI000C85236A|nr:helix-turn-helix transcriptional regulator [Galactobacillus timonensis]
MRLSYNKLWKLLIDKGMKKKDLREATRISANTVARMGKNEVVSLEVLMKICGALNCDIGDILEVLPDKAEA